ncbi:thiamine ABC transporter substrate-binding protein [Candidatus Poseidoniaceae archaeon]|nr:thiamine ABC transporter substrate-binding protein [Euryarchaeota archaeon]MDA9165988.1 thiamine ABC transporter substrate-binding protein [Candidatus Poseidoniaceae archaeon]
MKAIAFTLTLLLFSSLSGCLSDEQLSELESVNACDSEIQVRESDGTLKILTYDIFQGYSNELIEQFVNQTGIQVEVIRTDDAGGILDQMMLTQMAPQADLMLGLDNTYLPTALENCLLIEHNVTPENLTQSSRDFYDGEMALPFDEGDVCLNYDEDALLASNISVPTSLWDLTEPEWNGKLAIPSPITSSPGRAFLVATYDYFTDETNAEQGNMSTWWKAIADNGAIFTSGWTESYTTYYTGGYGEYTEGYIGGAYMTVSYCHSPGVEAFFAENYTHSTSLVLPKSSFHQVEYTGVIHGAAEVDAARLFIQYITSPEVNINMPVYNSMYSVIAGNDLPETNGYLYHSDVVNSTSTITNEIIEQNMDEWLIEWQKATQ